MLSAKALKAQNLTNQEQTCISKQVYESEMIVQTFLSLCKKTTSQSYYKCEVCSKYHIYTINNRLNKKREHDRFELEDELLKIQNRKKGRKRRKK